MNERERDRSTEPGRATADDEALRASVSRLMRGLNHDLKNPLGAAGGYLQLLGEGVLGELNERQRDTVGRTRGLLQDALCIVEDVVTFARASIGELETNLAPTDLAALARLTVDELRGTADEREVNLDAETPADPVELRTDGDRVTQILRHLIRNALEHSRAGGTVLVSVEREGASGAVALSVADDGPGIPEEDLDRVFLEFEKVGAGEGTGFGLPLSRALAQLLGGRLEVDSEPDVGSTFTLRLPAKE